ncbi:MAG: NmrA family NAD(P)-binding protein [bacterium]|nr:NmrA family NAD(P)-binding protein [bacterium]
MSIFIVGGTGTVGTQALLNLLEAGEKVSVMTRSAERAASLPSGVNGVVGNLSDPPSLTKAFSGIEKLFLITPVHPDEAVHGQNAVRAAKKAGVKKIVYLSVVLPPDSTHIPHFASKIPIENAIRESGIAFTIIRPNNFYQNDFWYKDVMLEYGLYPQPIGSTGIYRVDVRDVADAATNALTERGFEGKTINLNGPDALTGKECARIWSEHLGTEINYMGDDLNKWSESASASLPAWMVHDFRIMYDYFQKKGLKPEPADIVEAEKILHHKPRAFSAFCAECAEIWK